MNKAVKVVITLLVVAGIGGLAYVVMASRGAFEPEQVSNITTVTGEVGCLPLKDGTTPAPKTCQLGLRNTRGLFLELQAIAQNELPSGKRIEVTGPLSAPSTDSKYNVIGTMKVQKHSLSL